jgi:hypothetical protein
MLAAMKTAVMNSFLFIIVGNFTLLPAKVRISEDNTKQKHIFLFLLSSGSTFTKGENYKKNSIAESFSRKYLKNMQGSPRKSLPLQRNQINQYE